MLNTSDFAVGEFVLDLYISFVLFRASYLEVLSPIWMEYFLA